MLTGCRIILGVTGSVAAIKAPLIAHEIRNAGAAVIPVLTESALQFTTTEAMSVLSSTSPITSIFPPVATGVTSTWHVHLARSADAMLIAPCSANTIARLALGLFDNPVTLVASSLPPTTPLVIAPAMDEDMWHNPATQANLATLIARGINVIEPVTGLLASGLVGTGRMLEPLDLVFEFEDQIRPMPNLQGKRVLITGGPTHEPIDAVRFIGNRSSGKMAAALATEALRFAASEVRLIMGPSYVETPVGIDRTNVQTADEMLQATLSQLPDADLVIMAAAVADFRPAHQADGKIKKSSSALDTLELQPTTDILAEIATRRTPNQYIVGFALEKSEKNPTEALDYAKSKLQEKNLDLVVMNDIAQPNVGFEHDTNAVTMLFATGEILQTDVAPKRDVARAILSQVVARFPKQ